MGLSLNVEYAIGRKTILNYMDVVPVIKGICTFIPGITGLIQRHAGHTTRIDSARYCYSVWLRHLVMAYKSGLKEHPKVIAELGPGDSLGVGLAALISGAKRFYALDIVDFAYNESNNIIFDELVELFKNRTDIPDYNEFPKLKPVLDSYEFPNHILGDNYLNEALSYERIQAIRESIDLVSDDVDSGGLISYIVPWDSYDIIFENAVDMILSQAVLEHVIDIKLAYSAMHKWLKPNGFMSHQIDFKSHGTAIDWNGHWKYPDFVWVLISGKRNYLLNRHPYSKHIQYLKNMNFKIVNQVKIKTETHIKLSQLSKTYRNMSEDDLTTSGAFIQAVPT